MKHNTIGMAAILLIATGFAGCDTYETKTEREFGDSVRAMVDRQKVNSDATPAMGMDGVKTEQVLETYRKDVSKPADVKNEIQINVGTE